MTLDQKRIELTVGPTGQGTLIVDGQDISGLVAGVTIKCKAGQLTHVLVEMAAADVKYTGPATMERIAAQVTADIVK